MNTQESRLFFQWIVNHGDRLKVLNVGSGTSEYYKRQQPNIWNDLLKPLMDLGHEVTNLDIKSGDGVDISAPLHKIPVADKTYDVVLFSSVLEHIKPEHIEESINQIHRILKDDGIVIASVPASYPRHDVYDNGIRIKSQSEWFKYFDNKLWHMLDYLETEKLPAKPFYKNFNELTWMSIAKFVKQKDTVTVICLNWKRPDNIPQIMNSFSDWPIRPKVIMFDNSGKFKLHNTHGLDIKLISSSFNFQSMAKNIIALFADTEYVLFQDDDLMLSYELVNRMLECINKNPDSVICLKYGILDDKGNYYRSAFSLETKPVDFTVGRAMLVRRDLVGCSFKPEYMPIYDIGEEDLCLGLAIQLYTRKPAYVVSINGCKPTELPDHNGRVSRPWHMPNRTKTINMFKELGWRSFIG